MQLFRATGVVAVKIGGILALLPLLLGVVTLPAHADSSPFPSGSVLTEITPSNSPVRDSNGNPTGGGCMSGNYDNVRDGAQVVVLDSSKSFTANGNTYIYVAFGDSCDPQLDYTSRSIGWVDAADFNSTNAVTPPSYNATYRDCWTPNNCQDTPYSGSSSLQSKDNVLYAWWNGSAWDPHWWHVKDSKGNDAAVYGRDWGADQCSFLGC